MVRSDLIAFLLAVSSVFFAQESKAQEYIVEGNTLVDSNDNILYEIVSDTSGSTSWDSAKSESEAREGHLATITSSAEMLVIEQLYNAVGAGRELFIGGYRNSGGWTWVNEEGDFTASNLSR